VGAREASPSALTDIAIDVGAMATTGYLWRRELEVRDARLRRIAFGARLAALRVFQLSPNAEGVQLAQEASLSDLRRGRGQSRRIVIVCGPEETVKAAIEGASARASALAAADFLVVPLFTLSAQSPMLAAPPLEFLQGLAISSGALGKVPASAAVQKTSQTQPPLPWDEARPDAACGWPIGWPQAGGMWSEALSPELQAAAKQDASALERGFTIVLKKNGRVGTRRLGMPDWQQLTADVEGRAQAGLDVVNI